MSGDSGAKFLEELNDLELKLPFSPDVLSALFARTTDTSSATLTDIATVLSKDQALTARILTHANSAFYGLRAQVTTVPRAISVLGLREVKNIVMTLAVDSLAKCCPLPEGFDLEAYWEHHVLTALAAQIISRHASVGNPDDLYTCGLLHDLGKLITAMHAVGHWQAIIELAGERDLSYSATEDQYWGIDHGIIGSLILDRWNLPDDLCEPVSWHHAPDRAPIRPDEARVLRLADGLALYHGACSPGLLPGIQAYLAQHGLEVDEAMAELEEATKTDTLLHFVRTLG